MESMIFINGSLLPRQEAKISTLDRGVLYGYGLFETMRAYGGRVFRLHRHLERLTSAAQILGLASELAKYDVPGAIQRTMAANSLTEAWVRLTFTAGEGERRLAPPTVDSANLMIIAEKMVPPAPVSYLAGIKAALVRQRRNSQSPLSRIKSICFLENLIAFTEAAAMGAEEAILCNEQGYLAEGNASNLFFVHEEKLFTPSVSSGILSGITREAILELAPSLGFRTEEGEIKLEDFLSADEAFLTSTLREIMPIVQVDDKIIGPGVPGPITQSLMAAYRDLVREETTSAPQD
ncbi:MAG: aminotransferase class IV [Chloroflexi bacterium]|nr:aminotransferase class IV [Chloroflexota bacterium]